jgi:hypothetical protein
LLDATRSASSRTVSALLGEDYSVVNEALTKFDPKRIVDVENGNGHAADGRSTDEVRAVPAKVTLPRMPAWVKQRRQLARATIAPGDVRALENELQ